MGSRNLIEILEQPILGEKLGREGDGRVIKCSYTYFFVGFLVIFILFLSDFEKSKEGKREGRTDGRGDGRGMEEGWRDWRGTLDIVVGVWIVGAISSRCGQMLSKPRT